MKNTFNFLMEVSKLKNIKRKGMTFYGVKNPDTAVDHTFRTAMIVWILGEKKKFNMTKAIKIALVHNLCKVYAGDITPYDGLLPKNKKERYEFVRKWPPRASMDKKEKVYAQKFQREYGSLEKLTSKLPKKLRKEMVNLWTEYKKGTSPESRFVYQVDKVENLLGAFEWRKKRKSFPTKPWWEHADEVIDEPILLKFLKEIEKAELKG